MPKKPNIKSPSFRTGILLERTEYVSSPLKYCKRQGCVITAQVRNIGAGRVQRIGVVNIRELTEKGLLKEEFPGNFKKGGTGICRELVAY